MSSPALPLYDAILACIRAGTNMTNDIAAALGCSRATVHNRLHELKHMQRAHAVRRGMGPYRQMIWIEGAAPEMEPDDDEADGPLRTVLTAYPAIDRRDPLVAALFGAPGAANAPRCVGCGARHGACLFLGAV